MNIRIPTTPHQMLPTLRIIVLGRHISLHSHDAMALHKAIMRWGVWKFIQIFVGRSEGKMSFGKSR
jgi:hypothetical protein